MSLQTNRFRDLSIAQQYESATNLVRHIALNGSSTSFFSHAVISFWSGFAVLLWSRDRT
jgi:hypothetical protein